MNMVIEILTGALVVVTASYVIVTNRILKANKQVVAEMKEQTNAMLAPSIVVKFVHFGAQNDQANFLIRIFSSENIARNFHGQLFFDGKKIGEVRREVIYVGAPDFRKGFGITKEQYKNNDRLIFRYSYTDRTGKIRFDGEENCQKT